jgi:protein arginine N-methyltransferase 1
MYSLHFYGQMITGPRMEAYVAALRQAVTRDSVVMDLGCGPGVLALIACKLGARRVYAVEPENVIGLARELIAANGFAGRVEFFEMLSNEVNLPEPATIIVSDLRGVLPWFRQHIPSIIDARRRLLSRGGVLIPHRDILWAAVVEAPEAYEEIVGPWQGNKFDVDLSAGMRLVTNTWRKTDLASAQFLTDPLRWTTIDYYEVHSPDIRAEISWQAKRNGTAHGVAVWFDSELVEGIGFSNYPAAPQLIYGAGLFPFSTPLTISEGEPIKLRLAADLVQDNYVWRWDTDFVNASFKQSTFHGVPLTPTLLSKSAKNP